MSQGQGTISANDLMQKLARAKKVMDKVDNTSSAPRGAVNENYENFDDDNEPDFNYQQPITQFQQPKQVALDKNLSSEKIQNSKLPDAIKKAMLENPIPVPSISLSDNIDMNIIKGAKRLIEQELPTKTKQQQKNQPQSNSVSNIDMNSLSIMIENTVRKVLDEKLSQILSAHETKSINENLVLKVGDSIFKGKITGVNSSK